MYYTGRDMTLAHRGMRISSSDWQRFTEHLKKTLGSFELADSEVSDVVASIESTKDEIVEL